MTLPNCDRCLTRTVTGDTVEVGFYDDTDTPYEVVPGKTSIILKLCSPCQEYMLQPNNAGEIQAFARRRLEAKRGNYFSKNDLNKRGQEGRSLPEGG